MCVIIIKPRGKRLPPKEILKKAWDSNSHGAGYAINHKKDPMTTVQKGFMDFDAFYKALTEENVRKNDLVMLHFRLATHGYKTPEHTHPFPVSVKKEDMELLAFRSNMVCSHNGIFTLSGQPNDMSDTMYYIKGWLSQMDLSNLFDKEGAAYKEIKDDCQWSKIALIVNGSIHLFGPWSKHQGCFYSNLSSIGAYNNYKVHHATNCHVDPYFNRRGEYKHRREGDLAEDYYGGWIHDCY